MQHFNIAHTFKDNTARHQRAFLPDCACNCTQFRVAHVNRLVARHRAKAHIAAKRFQMRRIIRRAFANQRQTFDQSIAVGNDFAAVNQHPKTQLHSVIRRRRPLLLYDDFIEIIAGFDDIIRPSLTRNRRTIQTDAVVIFTARIDDICAPFREGVGVNRVRPCRQTDLVNSRAGDTYLLARAVVARVHTAFGHSDRHAIAHARII